MIGVIIVVLIVGGLLAYFFPEETERWFRRADMTRKGAAGLFWTALSLVMVGSGIIYFQLAGAAVLLFIFLKVVFDIGWEPIDYLRGAL